MAGFNNRKPEEEDKWRRGRKYAAGHMGQLLTVRRMVKLLLSF